MRGDVGEDFALRIEQNGGEHGAHHVGDGAGGPDAREPVHSRVGEQHRHDVGQRQQEEELPRQAGDDGDPGLVDGLEEVGVDDGEPDEREHHHQEAHRAFADVQQFGVGGEDFNHRDGEQAGDDASGESDEDADLHREHIDVLEAVGVAGAVVVAGDGLHTLADAEDEHHHQSAEGVHDAVGAHGKVAAVAQQLVVEHRHHEGGADVHQERAHPDEGDVAEDVALGLPSVGPEADEGGGLDEVRHGHDGGGGHRDGGGPGRAGDAQVHPEDEDGVQDHIQHRAAHHNEHRLHRVARGADQAGEVEGHRGEEHTRQHDEHIFAGVGEGLLRGAEAGQDAVHKQVAARHEQRAQHNGENHTVAQDLLRPLHVLAPQHD